MLASNKSAKYETLTKYRSYCTRSLAITTCLFKNVVFGLSFAQRRMSTYCEAILRYYGECIFHYRLKNMRGENERLTEEKRSISKLLQADELMNHFWGMLDLQTAGSRISRRDHCQEASPSWLPNRSPKQQTDVIPLHHGDETEP